MVESIRSFQTIGYDLLLLILDAWTAPSFLDRYGFPSKLSPMSKPRPEAVELTYALGAVSRLTGLSPELLRAWERRYGVVEPLRTPGGTRRYRAEDLERLRLLKAAVDAGHRIGNVASLPTDALRGLERPTPERTPPPLDPVLEAVERMDAAEAQRLIGLQLSALGPARFAREFAAPLAHEIGARWSSDGLGIASEHLATSIVRSMLGIALQPTAASVRGPRIAFATPSGERHELGIQMAALTALGAGASPIYLGVELPVEEMLAAVEISHAVALGVGIVSLPTLQAERAVAAIRGGLHEAVRLWIGGAGAPHLAPLDGVETIDDLEELEQRVERLGYERTREVRA